jgi:hypothetical protein
MAAVDPTGVSQRAPVDARGDQPLKRPRRSGREGLRPEDLTKGDQARFNTTNHHDAGAVPTG